MMIYKSMAALALLAFAPAHAGAESSPVEIKVGARAHYTHRPTKVALPPMIGGLQRSQVQALEANNVDVFATYNSADGGEVTTLYLFRKVAGDVPVWFDRAVRSIENSASKLGVAKPVVQSLAFVPPGQSTPSALRSNFSLSGRGYTSTGIALMSAGDYFLKVRMSSPTLSPEQLDARMMETLAAIRWPRQMRAQPAVTPVADCPARLKFSGDAKVAPKDGAQALLNAVMPSMSGAVSEKIGANTPPPRWCRDPRTVSNAGLYRANGSTDSYLLALLDAGRAVSVGQNEIAAILSAQDGKARSPRYSVSLVLLQEQLGYGDFLSLPPPEQVLNLIDEGTPIYRSSTIGKKNQVSISADALEDQ